MPGPAVDLRGVSVSRGGRILWANATLQVPDQAFTAMIGANGSGKTTFARLVLGLTKPDAGKIEVLGTQPRRGNPSIGLVPQHRRAPGAADIRCRDLVSMGAKGTRWGLAGRNKSTARAVEAALAATGAIAWEGRRLGTLSGGQQQRVSISAALVSDPRLLILDEPLAGLDLAGQVDLVELVHRLNHDRGMCVIFITHDLNPVLDHLDSAIYIADGRLRITTSEEIADPELLSRVYGTRVRVSRTADGCVFTRAE